MDAKYRRLEYAYLVKEKGFQVGKAPTVSYI